jgi:hypothetical protein
LLFELAWIIIADIESTGRETENPMSVKAWGSQKKKKRKGDKTQNVIADLRRKDKAFFIKSQKEDKNVFDRKGYPEVVSYRDRRRHGV